MKLFAVLIVSLAVAGCAQDDLGRYPSLLPRQIETRSDAEPVVKVVAATPDPALDRTLAGITVRLAQTQSGFANTASRADVATRAARGAATGSEAWITAQSFLAELDGYRAETLSALSEIEDLAIARGTADQVDYPGIDTARAAAERQLDGQTTRISALQASLPAA